VKERRGEEKRSDEWSGTPMQAVGGKK